MKNDRVVIKRDMRLFRVHVYGKADWAGSCWCDYCEIAPATEMHEIYSRGRTEMDDEARDNSYNEAICSMLCHSCHESHAHGPDGRKILVERNCLTYGKDKVRRAADKLPNPNLITQFIPD